MALTPASASRIHASEIHLAIGRTGNVFEPSEPIVVPITSTADEMRWSLIDFDGIEVASGTTITGRGPTTLVIESAGLGYFELQFEDPTRAGEPVRTSLVVAPQPTTADRPSPFGVMTHFAQGWEVDLIPLISRAGIRHVRDEQYWAQVEQERGRYRFPEQFTRYMDELARHDLKPLIVLSFSNDLYDEGLTPFTDQGRAGYARYGRAVLDRYGAQIETVEIWNEYNGSFCDGVCRDDRPAYYTRMLEQAYRAVKSVRPDVTVAGGAAVTIPLPYLEGVFAAGGLSFMDVLVVHPYGSSPERVIGQLHELRSLLTRYGRPDMPIWVTEFGQGRATPEGRREAASYLVRMGTALLAAGIDRMYWYLLRDAREFAGMGLLRAPDSKFGRYAPAPAYAAYAHLAQQLGGATFLRREASDPRSHIYLFEHAGREVRVAWTIDGPITLRLRGEERLAVLDVVGRERSSLDPGVEADVILDSRPVYITGKVRRLVEVRSDQLVADSVKDYSMRQGELGWYYGHYDGDAAGHGDGRDAAAYTDDDFELLETVTDAWSRRWGDAEYPWLAIGPTNAHPSHSAGRRVWAVRRWVSTIDGPVRITGRVSNASGQGDGVTAHVLVDGQRLLSTNLGGGLPTQQIEYDLETEVRLCTLVDFVLTPGRGHDINFDSSTFEARILRNGITPVQIGGGLAQPSEKNVCGE